MQKWMRIPLGPIQTNCYIVYNESKECLIFDPGEESKKLMTILSKQRWKPIAIFLTHAHFDHIGAVDDIRAQYSIPVYMSNREESWLQDPKLNGSLSFRTGGMIVKPADHFIDKESEIQISNFIFQVLKTPGHSPGSLSYYFPSLEAVIAGDTLFKNSIGRTDLVGGDSALLLKSIHQKLLVLPEDTLVLPGHEEETTIGSEMDSNPFLNGY
jgi:hydroxyacylglutathione hydrolase